MIQNRLIDLAKELGKAYSERAIVSIAIAHNKEDYDARILELRPEGGWVGKNEDERKSAKELAAKNDMAIQNITKIRVENENRLAALIGQIESMEAERRSLEWFFKGEFIRLSGGRIDIEAGSMPIIDPVMEETVTPPAVEPEPEKIKIMNDGDFDTLLNKIASDGAGLPPSLGDVDDIPF